MAQPLRRSPLPLLCVALLSQALGVARADECPETEPTDCLTIWQAEARGWLQVTSGGSVGQTVTFSNIGEADICLDEQILYTSSGTQSFFPDQGVTSVPIRLSPGASYNLYYGSWTTANGYYYPYLNQPAWWCVEAGQPATPGATFDYEGEITPDVLSGYTNSPGDVDSDGRLDTKDWAGSYGVQAEYSIWSWQDYHAVVSIGKRAEVSGADVVVTLTVRNVGANASDVTVFDTIPAGWSVSSYGTSPDSSSLNGDGTSSEEWELNVGGTVHGLTGDVTTITYTLSSDSDNDDAYLELEAASIDYSDGSSTRSSESALAAAYNIDVDGDGHITCEADLEVCDGVDNDGDGSVDEGFDADSDGFADCLETCVVELSACSAEDGQSTLSDGSPAVATYSGNPRWTASIAGATWIWDEALETDPDLDQIRSIFRSFEINPGYADLSATLEVAADNSYEIWLNGTSVGADATEYNYFAPTDIWDVSGAIAAGDNALEFEVWNWAQAGGSAYTNPGGLQYCLDVSYTYEKEAEICDGLDNDCDGEIDEGVADTDGDGSCDTLDTEDCDGLDNNGDGSIDEGFDSDSDGTADCFDAEECDGLDNDGDTSIDEGFDGDSDGTADCYDTETCDGFDNDGDGDIDEGFDADSDGTADCFDAEECDGLDNDGDGDIDEDFDLDGDGFTTCGTSEDCSVLFELAHGETTWSDPENYTTEHAWGYAADMLSGEGYTLGMNESATVDASLLAGYQSVIIAEPVVAFGSGEVDSLLEYVYGGGGLLLATDFNEQYMNPIATELGVEFLGYSGLIGWAGVADWDTGHPVSDGMGSVFWAYGSTLSVTGASVQVLATYSGVPVYAVVEYGAGRVVFSADNEIFASYGFDQIYDPDPSATRDNAELWLQTMGWLSECPEEVPADCDDTDPEVFPGDPTGGIETRVEEGVDGCDGKDNDCDGLIDEDASDTDGDGICDEADTEDCDGLDNDGDGDIDEGFDSDADGTADCFDTEECDGEDNDGDGDTDEGFDSDSDGTADCFDTEDCDGLDNDGDGDTDEGFDSDVDGTADCYDTEECDGEDNDGDGQTDEGFDSDSDGTADCFDTEACDDLDNDGDGAIDEGFDADADGEADCNDLEECDGLDNDGDGSVDEGNICGTEDCPEEVPADCLSLWQAHARGWLLVESDGSRGEAVTFTNIGGYDICLDTQVLYTSTGSQAFFIDETVTGGPAVIAPTESLTLWYASWTTDNGVFSPYLGEDAWWCVEDGQAAAAGATFDYAGEAMPDVLAIFGAGGLDEDGDGQDDLIDWAGGYGVQANYNIWAYQANHPVLTVGKQAMASGSAAIVTLVVRNIGALDGTGELSDTVPAGWTASGFSPAPDTDEANSDGSHSYHWTISALASVGGASTLGDVLTYTLSRDASSDAPYLELSAATLDYDDGEGSQESQSAPAAVYGLDVSGEGTLDCAEDEICDLIDNDLDGEIDEDCPVTIEGTVYLDTDKDGERDSNDPGMVDMTVTASGPDCDGDGSEDIWTASTDSDGGYLFEGLCAGDWDVEVTLTCNDKATDNPVAVYVDTSGPAVQDFAIERPWKFLGRNYWKTKASTITGYLPIKVGSTTYTSSSAVVAFLAVSPTTVTQRLQGMLLLSRLNTAVYGIDAWPAGDFDGDGELDTVAELMAAADTALSTGATTKTQKKLYDALIALL